MRIACRDEELWQQLVQDWRRDSLQSGGVFEHITRLNYRFIFFNFWFRLWNNEKTDSRIEAEGYEGRAGTRNHGRDHARWSPPFSAFCFISSSYSFPSLLPLLL